MQPPCCIRCLRPAGKDAPRPGDFHVCDGCGAVMRYTESLDLETVAGEDVNRFPWLRRLQHLIRTDRADASLA